jgi:hypothetical protein
MAKAKWRSLADFRIGAAADSFPPAERLLLERARAGEFARYQRGSDAAKLRASFVRFLLLGGDDDAPVHESGVRIEGATIEGVLDLDQCETARPFHAKNCEFSAGIIITDATLGNFCLDDDCRVGELADEPLGFPVAVWGDRATCKGSVFFCGGTRLTGALRLPSSRIAGSVNLSGGEFVTEGSEVVNLVNSEIEGDLEMRSIYPTGAAIPLPNQPGGPPERQFVVTGRASRNMPLVRLDNAHIANRARIIGAKFTLNGNDGSQLDDAEASKYCCLSAFGLRVDAGFMFHHVEKRGGVWLLGARLGTLADDPKSWGGEFSGNRFDGMTYGRIAVESPQTWQERKSWLLTQSRTDLRLAADARAKDAGGLKTQPWSFAADMLDKCGRPEDARRLRIETEKQVDKATPWQDVVTLAWRWVYRLFTGYGYAFRNLLCVYVVVWLFGSLCAYWGDPQKQFCVAKPEMLSAADKTSSCAAPDQGYPAFSPFIYALENQVPGFSVDQKTYWRPKFGSWIEWALRIQYGLGFVLSAGILAHIGSKLFRAD